MFRKLCLKQVGIVILALILAELLPIKVETLSVPSVWISYMYPDQETAQRAARAIGVSAFAVARTSTSLTEAPIVQALPGEQIAYNEWVMRRLICAARAEVGIDTLDNCLQRIVELDIPSEWFGTYLGENSIFGHQTLDGCNPSCQAQTDWFPNDEYGTYRSWRVIQIIAGVSADPYAVIQAFLDSPGHRGAILYPANVVIGVSLVYVEGSPYGYYWVIDFGFDLDTSGYTENMSPPWLGDLPAEIHLMMDPDGDFTTAAITVQNLGDGNLPWTVVIDGVAVEVVPMTGVNQGQILVRPSHDSLVCTASTSGSTIIGMATLSVVAVEEDVLGSPQVVLVRVLCVEDIYLIYLPTVLSHRR